MTNKPSDAVRVLGAWIEHEWGQKSADSAKRAADILDEAEKALAGAEAHIVMMYRGINPHANYDDEVTMRGSVSGSRLADKDEMVIGLRATLARIRGEKA